MSPPGALTWPSAGTPLPWTAPPGVGRARPPDELLRRTLANAGVDGPAQSYILGNRFTRTVVSSPRQLGRNFGLPALAVEIAVEHDIRGHDLRELAERLDLSDHKLVLPGSRQIGEGDPRGGRRYLSRGRRILKALGVWPWAHIDEWRAARPWFERRAVLVELLGWHDAAWTEAAEELALSARARHGAPPVGTPTASERQACERFRADLRRLFKDHDVGADAKRTP